MIWIFEWENEVDNSSNRTLLVASKVNKKEIIIENWAFIYLMTLMAVGPSKKYNDSRLDMVRWFS